MKNEKSTAIKFAKLALMAMAILPLAASAQFEVEVTEIADGYDDPTEIVNAGDERLFVVEQPGRIKIFYPSAEQISEPFLDISSEVQSNNPEQGLLGLAFPSDFCTEGVFYVNYTYAGGDDNGTRISRFTVNPDDENDALEDSEEILLEFDQPYSNHNGGQIEFGPDGYLYIATGDGGAGGDPENRAQDLSTLLGKMLRIDVSTTPYSIPDDNPFVDNEDALDEIWAYGLRNPWKFAFDPANGDMFIGDVGQNEIEEIDYQAAGSDGGLNYGWDCFEGTMGFENDQPHCDGVDNLVDPIFEYNHSDPDGFACSITGGRVFRGSSFDNLNGKYISADYCLGHYWLTWQEDGEWQTFDGGYLEDNITAFGTDVWGEVYAVDGGSGQAFRLSQSGEEFEGQISFSLADNTVTSSLEGDNYTWLLDGEVLDGANTQTIEVDESGTYTVIITSASGCEIESTGLDVTVVSTENNKILNALSIYPNPAANSIRVDYDLRTKPANGSYIELYTVEGKKVLQANTKLQKNSISIDLEGIESGVYFLHFRTDEGVFIATRKLIVQ